MSRAEDIEATLGAMTDALRTIASRGDCEYLLDAGVVPRPCPCSPCTARRALTLGAQWRFVGARSERIHNDLNPRETLIVDAWRRYLEDHGPGADYRLGEILRYGDNDHATPSPRDWYVATSVVQWLATNVGSSILNTAGFAYRHYDGDRRVLDARRRARELGRPTVRVASGLALRDDGTMLMALRRPNRTRPCMWEHPGGKIEEGESAADAVQREWLEELGVAVTVGRLIVRRPLVVEVTLDLSLFHVAIPEGQQPRALDSDGLQWVTLEHAIKALPCTPATYLYFEAIEEFLRDRQLELELNPEKAP